VGSIPTGSTNVIFEESISDCFLARLALISTKNIERKKTMVKIPPNNGKPWSSKVQSELKSLAQHNTPTRVIGLKMGRTPASIQSKATGLGISLKPTNQSPYGTKKK